MVQMSALDTHSFLETILHYKRTVELPDHKASVSDRTIRERAEAVRSPAQALATSLLRSDGHVALIAEIKRASPSKGILVKGTLNPAELAKRYAEAGASAISVLTDERFFMGTTTDLQDVHRAVSVPVLRKDFIVEPYQVYEARSIGADAVLLIVAALEDTQLADLYKLALSLTLTPLVEVHNERETERAMQLGARVIGVNNRDLNTFQTNLSTTERCAKLVHSHTSSTVLVSESGIYTAQDVHQMAAMGVHAVLVGESIITSNDIAGQVRALSSVMRTSLKKEA